MNFMLILLMVAVTTFDYLVLQGTLPRILKYTPETISAITLLLVVILGAKNKFQFVRPAYWFAFTAMGAIIICGVFANALESGPLFAGVRSFFRAVPLFFLSAVYAFSERNVRTQLIVLLLICILQLPLAIDQRAETMARGGATGDATTGTLTTSGMLSVFLISAACVLTAMFIRKRINGWVFLILFILILAPTTLNETKATVFLLPLGLLVVFLTSSRDGMRLKNAVMAVCLLGIFAAIFIPIYDHYIVHREYGTPLMEFFTKEGRFEGYISKDAKLGSEKAGRVDALAIPLREIAKDPATLAFGFGIGNASDSALGEQFVGKYYYRFEPFILSSASVFLLETGLLGLILALVLCLLVYKDSRAVMDSDSGLLGALAVGWTGVATVIAIATFYVDVVAATSLSYLFWYFSGLVAAQRVRLVLGVESSK